MEQRIEQLEQQTKKDAERIAVLEQLVHELTLFKDVATAKQQKKKREKNVLLAPSIQRFQWCSSIVSDNNGYMEHLSQWMYSVGYRPSELLYRASSHGWKSSDFHRKCDNRGSTLTIVKTTGGVIIGGFTVNSWQSDGSDVEENGDKAWLFSLNHPTHGHIRLNYIKHGCVQYNGPSSGPVFGSGRDLYINGDSNAGDSSFSDLGYSYTTPIGWYESEEAQQFLAGSFKFTVADWEVIQATPL